MLLPALFGLSEDLFAGLAKEVDAVIHNGCNVNGVYPYALLRDANVGGVKISRACL